MKTGKIISFAIIAILGVGMIYMITSDLSVQNSLKPQQNDLDSNLVKSNKTQTTTYNTESELKRTEQERSNELKRLSSGLNKREFSVSRSYLVNCAPCHGDNGQGKIAPPLIGKSKDEILKRLYDYKNGNIKNSLMSGLLSNVDNVDLQNLADEISKFKP